jgi:diguanylate cyclase (GGDEF)-like protein/putative nucleotidyltransferase with HDIG domain
MGLLPTGESRDRTFGVGSVAVPISGHFERHGAISSAPLVRGMCYLGIGAAVLGFVAVLLPHPERFSVPGLVAMQALMVAISVVLLIYADRIPFSAVRILPATGTVIGTLCVIFSGDATSAFAIFYLWVALFAFYFLSWRDAAAHVVLAAVGYSIAIAVVGRPTALQGSEVASSELIHHFVITAGTLVIVGLFLLYLRKRVEKLMGRLTDAARTDLLTGLRNTRGLHEALESEIERAGLGNRKVSVLIADLDGFKDVNDRFGHATGDRVLMRIGQTFDQATRRIDTVARTGGGEFTILLPEADEHTAYLIAEQLLSRVRRGFSGEEVPLTTSVGVATYPLHGKDVDSLITAADTALFAAKGLGRNRAVLYNPEISEVLSSVTSKRSIQAQGHLATVLSLAEALDLRERGTASHSQSVGRYSEMIARELGMPPDKVERVRLGGILHDIGKVAVPDAVLQKPGPLDNEEWKQMRQHPEHGARILGSSELSDIREWVMASHERPDGRGYPRGLKGDEIPVESRILAVADAYEAMSADRIYRPSIGEQAAREELRRGAGAQFDAAVVDAFLRSLERAQPRVATPDGVSAPAL